MNCLASQEYIQRLLDGQRGRSPAGFADHLHACSECRDMHLAALVLQDGLTSLEWPEPSPDLGPRIVRAVLAERRARRRWSAATVHRLALAASVVFLFLAAALTPRTPMPTPPPPQAVAVKQSPPPTLRDMADEAREAVTSLTRRTANETVETTRPVVAAVAPPAPAEVEVPTPLANDSLRGVRDGMSSGLQPVTNSARRAVNLFLREVPPLEPEPRTGS